MDQEEAPQGLLPVYQADQDRLPHLHPIAENGVQIFLYLPGKAPMVVVIAPDPQQAPFAMKSPLSLQGAPVCLDHVRRPFLPQFLYIAQGNQGKTALKIIGQGVVVGAFRRLKIIGRVARPFV